MSNSETEKTSPLRLFRWFLAGAAVGAASAYLFDPDQGRKRRLYLRDQSLHRLNNAGASVNKSYRNLQNHGRGFVAKMRSAFRDFDTDNQTLLNRVRSKFGHHVSHPRAIFVRVHDGEVILTGHVLAAELDELLGCVRDVPGVKRVLNHLRTHEEAGSLPQMQGDEPSAEYLQ